MVTRSGGELGPYVGGHGTGTLPIIVGDLVVLANEQEDPAAVPEMYGQNPKFSAGKSFLIAVECATGKTRWQLDRRTSVAPYSTPGVRRVPGGAVRLIFAGTGHGVTAVDAATGKVRWEGGDFGRDRCIASPVLGPDLVLVSHGWGLRGRRVAAFPAGPRPEGNSWTPLYEVTRSPPLVPTPLVKDGRLYLWCDDGVVSCLNVANGDLICRERVGGTFTVRRCGWTDGCIVSPETAKSWCWPRATSSRSWPACPWASQVSPPPRLPVASCICGRAANCSRWAAGVGTVPDLEAPDSARRCRLVQHNGGTEDSVTVSSTRTRKRSNGKG